MPDCDYCGEAFDDEQSLLEHLDADHGSELGAIDRRRVDAAVGDDDDGLSTGPIVLGVILGVSILIGGYVVFAGGFGGSGGPDSGTSVNGIDVAQTPGQVSDPAHGHGTIEMTVDGQRVDFGAAEYQRPREFDAFHFEGGDGRVWHKHADGVTLEYAMATLGIDVSENSVTIDGETYRDNDADTTVSVTVNGETVAPASYELQGASAADAADGDTVRIVVTTDG
jgi:hypothetical protein